MTAHVAPQQDADGEDGPAIAELRRLHDRQRQAFLADPYPDADTRRARLSALGGMVLGHREQIRAAMSADFGIHPELFTDLVEVLGIAGRAAYAVEQIESWMAQDRRPVDPSTRRSTAPPRLASVFSPRVSSATSCRGTSRSTWHSARW